MGTLTDGVMKVRDALMKKQNFQGTSPQTRDALIKSGAMHPDDFRDDPEPAQAPTPAPSTPTKYYVPAGKSAAEQAAEKASADAAYLKFHSGPKKR